MYTHHIGRQKLSGPLDPDQPTGLTLNRTLLPQYLKQAGYSTHMIGKCYLGFCKNEYMYAIITSDASEHMLAQC